MEGKLDTIPDVDTIARVNSKHRQTLKAIFALPASKTIQWVDVEALLIALGAQVYEGSGSRVKFELNGATIAFHRPHNPKTARAYQIEMARQFLTNMGVTP